MGRLVHEHRVTEVDRQCAPEVCSADSEAGEEEEKEEDCERVRHKDRQKQVLGIW